jgi:hypothetical protein
LATGTIIAESLRVPSTLGVPLTVREVERVAAANLSDEQRAAGVPEHSTLLHFELADEDAPRLAEALAAVMDRVGWYANVDTAGEIFVVFADRVFRYARDDAAGRAEAEAYGRERGVPDAQLDW